MATPAMNSIAGGTGIRPCRVLVAGPSGAGKTTLCRRLAEKFDLPHIELDQLYYRTGWATQDDFVTRVTEIAKTPEWITEWHYPEVQKTLLENAELLIHLDYPRWLAYTSTVLRTMQRSLHKEVLWDGLVEPAPWRFIRDEEHILRTSWRDHTTEQLQLLAKAPECHGVRIMAFRRPQALSSWVLAGFPGTVELTADNERNVDDG
jgi:adenylate kinase family enzyme